jgi:hypothetical protein
MSLTESGARAYEEAEAQTAQAMERLVGTRGFGGLLGQLAENSAAIRMRFSFIPIALAAGCTNEYIKAHVGVPQSTQSSVSPTGLGLSGSVAERGSAARRTERSRAVPSRGHWRHSH